jgi:hypothetical protein
MRLCQISLDSWTRSRSLVEKRGGMPYAMEAQNSSRALDGGTND